MRGVLQCRGRSVTGEEPVDSGVRCLGEGFEDSIIVVDTVWSLETRNPGEEVRSLRRRRGSVVGVETPHRGSRRPKEEPRRAKTIGVQEE